MASRSESSFHDSANPAPPPQPSPMKGEGVNAPQPLPNGEGVNAPQPLPNGEGFNASQPSPNGAGANALLSSGLGVNQEQQGVAPILRVKQVSKSVASADAPDGRLTILHHASLDVARGEAVALIGASGAGKSTLLALLAGLDSPTTGEITLAGFELSQLSEDERAAVRAGRVGFVFQSFQLIDGLTALENVALPLELHGVADAEARARAALDEVGLSHRLRQFPRVLSGGEQQRVALARAFAGTPAILFADEPTGSLDTATGARIIELMFALRDRHATTLVLVTHDPKLAARCDKSYVINAGVLQPWQAA